MTERINEIKTWLALEKLKISFVAHGIDFKMLFRKTLQCLLFMVSQSNTYCEACGPAIRKDSPK